LLDKVEVGDGKGLGFRGVYAVKWRWLDQQHELWAHEGREEWLTFPGASTAPPMTTTSLTLKKVSGSFAAAIARFVSGPTATMVTVSGSFSANICSITSCAGFRDGMNSLCFSLTASKAAASSADRFSGVGKKRDFQVSSGER
jgi:hypothetical protein